MPTKRLTMRRIHRLMTLRFGAGATTRAISRELGISHSTVREYLARITAAGITWPLPAELSDRELEQRLFVNGGVRGGARHHVEPDWAAVAREMKRPCSATIWVGNVSPLQECSLDPAHYLTADVPP